MGALEDALASAGEGVLDEEEAKRRTAVEAADQRRKLLAGVRKVIHDNRFTAEEIFSNAPDLPETAPPSSVMSPATPSVVPPPGEPWDEASLTEEVERLFREGKSKDEVGAELQKLVPGDDVKTKVLLLGALQAGEAAAKEV